MVYGGQTGHAVSKFSEARDFERQFPPQPIPSDCGDALRQQRQLRRQDASDWEEHPFDEGLPGLEDIEWAKYWMKKGRAGRLRAQGRASSTSTRRRWPQVRRRFYREGDGRALVNLKILRHIPREVLARDPLAGSTTPARRRRRGLLRTVGARDLAVPLREDGRHGRRHRRQPRPGQPGAALGDLLPARLPGRRRPRAEQRPASRSAACRASSRARCCCGSRIVGICATDLEVLEGTLGYYKSGKAHYPIVPGHESSGTVVAVGPRVTSFDEGDRVVVECIQGCGECAACDRDDAIQCRERREVGVMGHDGAYATYLITRARYVHRVPEPVTLAQAALTEPLAVVHKALRRLGSQPSGRPSAPVRRRRRRHHRPADGTRAGAARPCRDGVRSPAGAAVDCSATASPTVDDDGRSQPVRVAHRSHRPAGRLVGAARARADRRDAAAARLALRDHELQLRVDRGLRPHRSSARSAAPAPTSTKRCRRSPRSTRRRSWAPPTRSRITRRPGASSERGPCSRSCSRPTPPGARISKRRHPSRGRKARRGRASARRPT